MERNNHALRRFFAAGHVVIFFGQSGCGKGTQVVSTIEMYTRLFSPSAPYLLSDSGNNFRTLTPKMKNFSRVLLEGAQQQGKFHLWVHPTSLIINKFYYQYEEGPIFLDGSPRNGEENKAIIDFFCKWAKKKLIVLKFNVRDEICDQRMQKRNEDLVLNNQPPRSDSNTPEKREMKLSYYHTDTLRGLPVLAKCPDCTIYEIDGEQHPDEVFEQIMDVFVMHVKS